MEETYNLKGNDLADKLSIFLSAHTSIRVDEKLGPDDWNIIVYSDHQADQLNEFCDENELTCELV